MMRLAVARLAPSPVDCEAAPGWLGESERRRWPALPARARSAFTASRALLRALLHEATGVPGERWDVSADAGRAPIATSSAASGAIHVSLSHRLGWVAAAVADAAVGVDLEVARPRRSDSDERASLMLSADEAIEWRSMAAGDRDAALLARWTAKEAWFKASPPQVAPWDFRLVQARESDPTDPDANVRTWRAAPVHLAVCCAGPRALAAARCDGLPPIDDERWWRVARAPSPGRV